MTEPSGATHPDLLKPAGQSLGTAPPRGGAPPRRGMFSSLRHRPFRGYLEGLFLSNTGSWMQTVAQGWLVFRLSDSPLVLGLVTFAGAIPTLLLVPFAGVAADRFDRRKLLIATQSLQMATALFLAIATFFGFVSVSLVALVAAVNGVANAYTTPSHQSLFMDLVGRDDLMNAISLNSLQFNLSRVVGPIIAGLTIASLGESGCFLVNSVSYLPFLVAIAGLPSFPPLRKRTRGAWVDLRSGLRFARRDAILPSLLALSASLAVFGTPAVTLAPLYARRLLHVGPQGLGGMLSAVGIGAVATALGMAWLGNFPRKGLALLAGASAFAISLACLALAPSYTFAFAALALLGGGMMSASSITNTLMQTRAPEKLRGRIISLYALAWLGFVPIGNLQAGAVAERFGPGVSLLIGAAGIVVTLVAIRLIRPIPTEVR
ncbi:MAG: MFS transporter [Acidobacteriota bacterium]|nr:MFS transporter [Acidobacteriota bacterium]